MKKYKNTKEQYEVNHRVNEQGITERRCTACEDWKPETIEHYYMMNKSRPEKGFMSECKKCTSKRNMLNAAKNPEKTLQAVLKWHEENKERMLTVRREYNLNNKDKSYEYMSGWQKRNPDKLKTYGKKHRNHDITKTEEIAMLRIFENRCAYCGKTAEQELIDNKGKLHREHVDDDGANDLSNCVPSCQNCNSSKANRTIEELYNLGWIKEFTEDKYNKIVWWVMEGYKNYIEEKPPYKLLKKQNEEDNKFHWELWTVDEKRNTIECVAIGKKKDDLNSFIQENFKL